MPSNHRTALTQHTQELKMLEQACASISEGKSFLTSLGKGISVPVVIHPGSWYVEVGAGIVLEKSSTEIQTILQQQQAHLAKVIEHA